MPAQDERGPGRGLRGLALSAFGLGTAPLLPGTVASAAVAASLGACQAACSGALPPLAAALALLALGSWATLRYARFGADAHDPAWVVSDEVAGQALAWLGALPFAGEWWPTAASFLLFRVFDIAKWGPVGRAERLPGAVGILLDDLVAGAIAAALVLLAGALGVFG